MLVLVLGKAMGLPRLEAAWADLFREQPTVRGWSGLTGLDDGWWWR
jgi:hypothetical protein